MPGAAPGFRGNLLKAPLSPAIASKLDDLKRRLQSWGRVVVLFSGGVDSTLLLQVAVEVLGPEGVVALTCTGPHCPAEELAAAQETARRLRVRHLVVEFDPFGLPEFRDNTPRRCYACKRAIYQKGWEIAAAEEAEALLDGAQADDAASDRPGLQAAVELGVYSPLRETGWTKAQIREVSRVWGLPGWDRPAQSCLATRFPTNTPLDATAFRNVDRIEAFLRQQGFGPVRLRVHGDLGRLELPPEQWAGLLAPEILGALQRLATQLGWRFLTLDLGGYRSGSMNQGPGKPDLEDAALPE